MHNLLLVSLTLLLAGCLSASAAPPSSPEKPSYHSFAPTPPMGWNSWDSFGTAVTEDLTKANADYMAQKLLPHGWNLITVDIQWYEPASKGFDYKKDAPLTMDAYGRLLPAETKFPSAKNNAGFKPLADYVHSKGLKFGIHMMRGIARQAVAKNCPILNSTAHAADIADKTSTCPWNPDMFGVDMSKPGAQEYYDSVLAQVATWGVDFIKIDDLSRPYHQDEIEAIRKAIDKTGRPIVFSTSPGETPLAKGEHVATHANMWRISDDFWDKWEPLKEQFLRLHNWTAFRGPGHYPDADMLPLGSVRTLQKNAWTNFTHDEQLTLMTLWSIAQSPLIMGGHLPKNDDWTLSLMTNDEVLAVDQHSENGHQLYRKNDLIAWVADVPDSKSKYVALFNAQDDFSPDPASALFKSDIITAKTPNQSVDITVDLPPEAKRLYLVVDDAGDGIMSDHVDWVEPHFVTPAGNVKLTTLKWVSATSGWNQPSTTHAVSGKPMNVNGTPVTNGIGTHANSVIAYDVPAGATQFVTKAGLDKTGVDEGKGSTVRFLLFTKTAAEIKSNTATLAINLHDLGYAGHCTVRDLWAKKDLGDYAGEFSADIPHHSAGLYKITPR